MFKAYVEFLAGITLLFLKIPQDGGCVQQLFGSLCVGNRESFLQSLLVKLMLM
jgi:hypothetical protein